MAKLSMKSDYVFGEFFSRKGNEELLKDFLTSIMEVEIRKNRSNTTSKPRKNNKRQ